jgi:hypothetical protein
MKSIAIILFVLVTSIVKSQNFAIDFNTMNWVDVNPDKVVNSGNGSASSNPFYDTLFLDLNFDSQFDIRFSSFYSAPWALGGHTDAVTYLPINNASTALADSFVFNYYGTCAGQPIVQQYLPKKFISGDSIVDTLHFTTSKVYLYYIGSIGNCFHDITESIYSTADSIAYPCIKIMGDYYFLKLVYHTKYNIVLEGYYTTNSTIGLKTAPRNLFTPQFSEQSFYCTFKESVSASFLISDMLGRELHKTETRQYPAGQQQEIKLPGEPGVYVITVIANNTKRSFKFVVQ